MAGTVRVATVHSIGLYELSTQLKRYLKAYPQVHLQLGTAARARSTRTRSRADIDLGIVAYPSRRPRHHDRSRSARIASCWSAAGASVREASQISTNRLAGEALVGFDRDIPTRRETDRVLRQHGVEVRYVMELDNVEMIKRVVEIGLGIAILPEQAVRPEVKGGRSSPCRSPTRSSCASSASSIGQGKHFSPAAEKFIECLREE